MEFYRYRPDANRFAGIGFSLTDEKRIVDVHFTDEPLAGSWVAPAAHGYEDNPDAEGDFLSLSNFNDIPAINWRAWEALRPLISYCCEVLPFIHPSGDPHFLIHVMESVDCMNYETSEFTRNATTGRVNRVYCYSFKREMLHGKHIFKLPLESGGELIVDHEFRRVVEANGLLGLQFKKLPTRE